MFPGLEEDAEVAAAMADKPKGKGKPLKSKSHKSKSQASRPKSVASGKLMHGRVCAFEAFAKRIKYCLYSHGQVCLGRPNSASPQLLRDLRKSSCATAFLEFSAAGRYNPWKILLVYVFKLIESFGAVCLVGLR